MGQGSAHHIGGINRKHEELYTIEVKKTLRSGVNISSSDPFNISDFEGKRLSALASSKVDTKDYFLELFGIVNKISPVHIGSLMYRVY